MTGVTSARITTANVLAAAKLPSRRLLYMRLASTSVPKLPFVVAFTRSKTFITVTMSVVTTTINVGMIWGSVMRQNTWRSLAPSTLAASTYSIGTALIEADSTTMANPVWIQIMMIMMKKLFQGMIFAERRKSIWSWPKRSRMAFSSPGD